LKIAPATGQDVSEIDEICITVKLLKDDQDNLNPVFYIVSPGDQYDVSVMHLRLLVNGLQLGIDSIDNMINCMLQMMRSNALENMQNMGLGDNPVELERILNFIASLENDIDGDGDVAEYETSLTPQKNAFYVVEIYN
jgi:hypothetical protein